jgi:hypothetical protein
MRADGRCPPALFLTLRDDLRILGSLSEGGAVPVEPGHNGGSMPGACLVRDAMGQPWR